MTKAPAPSVALTPEQTAIRWLGSLTPRERIAQLLVLPFNGHPVNMRTRAGRQFMRFVNAEHPGGLILINVANGRISGKPSPVQVATFVNRMQNLAKIPLLVGGDFERGASMRVDGTTMFPHAMAFTAAGDPALARAEGAITAKEARALGVHWIFFPDADVNENPDNPIINIRSYGEEPADVSRMVSAFIEGAHSVPDSRVLVTAKHFPGHGDTAIDTHMNLASISGDRAHLEKIEWAPFRAAISSGVDSIMSAHLAVPSIDDAALPATLSSKLLTGILREEMGFQGLIVTDALEMGGIAEGFPSGDAAVRALEAGVDVLLMPPDPEAALNAVAAAVRSGRLTQKRIDESAMRILMAKARIGLGQKKLVDVSRIQSTVNTAASNATAQEVADRAVTLLRNHDRFFPIQSPLSTAFFLLTESRNGVEGQAMAMELRRRAPGLTVIQMDPSMSESDIQAAAQSASGAGNYLVAAYVSVAAYRGNVALSGAYPALMQTLLATKKPVALVALGNPYLMRTFPDVAAYMTTFSSVPPSEVAAVKAMFGEMAIGGRLPITIPELAKHGDGIRRTD